MMFKSRLFYQTLIQASSFKCIPSRGILPATPKGPVKYDIKSEQWEHGNWKEKMAILKERYVNYFYNLKEEFKAKKERSSMCIEDGDSFKIFNFDNPESLKYWVLSKDSDWNEGFSTANFEYNDKGFATFHGYLESEKLPETGEIHRVGWANIMNEMPPLFLNENSRFDFSDFTHLTLKIRGDGRNWSIILREKGNFDLSWLDIYQYTLFTHGGPYWQKVKIPFSKFILTSSGMIQDKQIPITLDNISAVGLTIKDHYTGPFKLDIEYIGLEYDSRNYEEFSYEFYFVKEDAHHEII